MKHRIAAALGALFLIAAPAFALLLLPSAPALSAPTLDPTGPDTRPPPAERLKQDEVRRFLIDQLTKIARRDAAVFERLSDDNRLLGSDWTKKALRYEPKDAAFWARAFPGYHRLGSAQLRSLKVTRLDGPLRVTLRQLAGGTEARPLWRDVPAMFVLARVSVPGKPALTCHVYQAEGELYWRPFGW